VYDVGANVGFYTLLGSVLVGSNGHAVAFEPFPRNLSYLHRHLALNDVRNAIVMAGAVYDHGGVVRLTDGPDSCQVRVHEMGSLTVQAFTLDDLVFTNGLPAPTVMKIDVEGAELSVLRGATKTIEKYQPLVYFEFLPLYASQYGFGYDDFVGFFAPLGYSLHWINHDANGPELFSVTESTYLAAMPPCRSGLLHQN